jgi:hypothetical protein
VKVSCARIGGILSLLELSAQPAKQPIAMMLAVQFCNGLVGRFTEDIGRCLKRCGNYQFLTKVGG